MNDEDARRALIVAWAVIAGVLAAMLLVSLIAMGD